MTDKIISTYSFSDNSLVSSDIEQVDKEKRDQKFFQITGVTIDSIINDIYNNVINIHKFINKSAVNILQFLLLNEYREINILIEKNVYKYFDRLFGIYFETGISNIIIYEILSFILSNKVPLEIIDDTLKITLDDINMLLDDITMYELLINSIKKRINKSELKVIPLPNEIFNLQIDSFIV